MKRVEIRLLKKICVFCHEHRARYRYRGRVRWNRQHSACFRCFRSYSDRLRAASTAAAAVTTQDAENSLGTSPAPLLIELERPTDPTSSSGTPYAGAARPTLAVEPAQDAVLSGGTL
jgi:hypothetical protein